MIAHISLYTLLAVIAGLAIYMVGTPYSKD